MQIGDTVKSRNKKGQIKCAGTLVGLIKADYYAEHMVPKGVDLDPVWGKSCPGWRDNLVALVYFNHPQRTATKKEWVTTGVAQGYDKKTLEKNYETDCPVRQSVVFPIADLENA